MPTDGLKITTQEIDAPLESEVTLSSEEVDLEPAGVEIQVWFRAVPCSGKAVVSGRVQASFQSECAVCLAPLNATVEEAFTCDYPILADSEIDLTPDVRDAFMTGTPIRRKCSQTCKGLCSKCGKDLNQGPCSCPPPETARPLKTALDEALERGSSTSG